jgi:hypothetical protein
MFGTLQPKNAQREVNISTVGMSKQFQHGTLEALPEEVNLIKNQLPSGCFI